MKESKNIIMAVLGAILIGGAGFYGGTLYQKGISPRATLGGRLGVGTMGRGFGGGNDTGGANGASGQRVGGMGFRPVAGQIISKDDKSITVKMQDGSSKIVILSDTTQISKADKIDATSLVVGATVRVFGTTNADGSVMAQDIQLNSAQPQQGQSQPSQ